METTLPTTLLVLAAVLATLPASATGPQVVEGDDVIACQLTVAILQAKNCAPLDARNGQQALPAAERTTVSFTVDWVPTSQWTQELEIQIAGNNECQDTEGAGCHRATVVGPPPLTLTLSGVAASGSRVVGAVLAAPACDGADCNLPPASLIVEQGYHYVWSSS